MCLKIKIHATRLPIVPNPAGESPLQEGRKHCGRLSEGDTDVARKARAVPRLEHLEQRRLASQADMVQVADDLARRAALEQRRRERGRPLVPNVSSIHVKARKALRHAAGGERGGQRLGVRVAKRPSGKAKLRQLGCQPVAECIAERGDALRTEPDAVAIKAR